MRKLTKLLFIFCLLILIFSCASLNKKGELVEYKIGGDPPEGSKYLGDISAGIGFSLFSQMDVINSLRNQAAEMGGNYLIINDITAIPNAEGGYGGYSGTGRVYFVSK